MFTSNIVSWIA